MNTPPLLLAAACAFWAVQTGQWLVAAAVALALEAPRLVPVRWNVAQAHFNRLSDFCSVLVIAVAAYLYFTFGNPRAILLLFQWLPVALLPLALAQAWGNQPRIGIGAFVWNLRKYPEAVRYGVNFGYPYFATWLVAASAVSNGRPLFYAGMVVLAGWALWRARSPRGQSPAIWLALLAAAAGAGYGGQLGLSRLQAWIEESVPDWIAASGSRTDPYRSRTDLGHIGELKMDDAIVLRVRPDREISVPLLLHRASYNSYFGATWLARNAALVPRPPDATARWVLAPAVPSHAARVLIYDYSPRGKPVLSLPQGTVEITGLGAPEIRTNGLGTVQAEFPPGHFTYTAVVDAQASTDAAPSEEDLRVPRNEQALLAGIAQGLGLAGMAPERAVARVRAYFAEGFGYSMYQAAVHSDSPIDDFLTRTRAGHCEYFATATALLLRAGGVPARYATGFSVQEYSRIEGAWIVRERHAHAWARAWVNGRWIDVDTTPATWVSVEAGEARWWSPLADLWAWVAFRISRLAAGVRSEDDAAAFWSAIALVLAAWLGWRLYRQRRLLVIGRQRDASARDGAPLAGSDSEFFMIERALAKGGFPREPGETLTTWLARISSRLPASVEKTPLAELASLHYRYRFDPAGICSAERQRLRTTAQEWLARNTPRLAA